MIPAPARTTGEVKTWFADRGFGFATPAQGGPDVFIHVNSLSPGWASPEVGDTVSFEIELSPEGKRRAKNVQSPRRLSKRGTLPISPPRPHSGRLGYLAIAGFAGIYLVIDLLRPIPIWVAVLYLGASVVCFIAYAIDKSASRTGGWRVPESSLLALGVIGGWPGAIVAQQVLRHKTVKTRFRLAFWLTVVLNVAYFVLLAWITTGMR